MPGLRTARLVTGLLTLLCASATLAQTCTQATVYRYRNTLILGHFYTTNQADGSARIAAGEPLVFEGAAFNACSGGNKSDGIYPVFRFKHLLVSGVYFYSMLDPELAVVRTALSGLLRDEGIAYYAYNFQPAGTFPVYRFRNAAVAGANFYTISEAEKASILASVPGYPFEGIGFWALPPSSTAPPPPPPPAGFQGTVSGTFNGICIFPPFVPIIISGVISVSFNGNGGVNGTYRVLSGSDDSGSFNGSVSGTGSLSAAGVGGGGGSDGTSWIGLVTTAAGTVTGFGTWARIDDSGNDGSCAGIWNI